MINKEELLMRAAKPSDDALKYHPFFKGKIQMVSKCAIRDMNDFAIWYTPGVAAVCNAIAADPELSYEHTNRANMVAIVSDGTRVLGLGNIGPRAGMPVMEGKALLFKYLGGVDAVPICLDARNADEIVNTVRLIQPSFGGINLEDLEQPKCFTVLDTLRADPAIEIPVWHDDQQGTATVLMAGLINALKLVGKRMDNIRVAMIGLGAANVATVRLLVASGARLGQIIAVDSKGILSRNRKDIELAQDKYPDKWLLCSEGNEDGLDGDAGDAMRGADVVIGFSKPGPDTIRKEWVANMAKDAIVFPCANPVPEIWPWDAKEAGARIVGTGRSDFPNQLNNSLGFPGIFRGALDVRARTITDEMCLAAAAEIAKCAEDRGIDDDNIIPTMDELDVFPREAVAVGMKAIEQGVARLTMTREELFEKAERTIRASHEMAQLLMREGAIAPMPADL
ncbi:MAG: NADP-dependent malic enzyme [Chloroflexi bacterium]|jgi:malate dehydrogenase (oxaloacetate-decarboxylating)|nr:NADP-dependent malic enzyme [Chloroflexota bacterium]